MKIWTSILAAVAILALAASAGNAANSMIPRDLGTNPDRVVLRADVSLAAQVKRLKAKNRSLAAQNKALAAQKNRLAGQVKSMDAWISVLLEQLRKALESNPRPMPAPPTPDQQLQECIDYGTGCTPEQLCAHWGECYTPAGSDTGGESTPAAESEASMSNELPSFDSSELPEELTGAVEFDYSVYDWEG